LHLLSPHLHLLGHTHCTCFSTSNPHQQHPSPTIHQIATNHHDYEEEPIILSISNIFTKVEIDDMLQLIDNNESVLTPTLTYQEDVFSKEAWDAEDSTLRRVVQPLLDDGTIKDDDTMNEKDGALRTFVYAVTNHPDRILQEDIIIGANIIQRREAIERWKSEEGLSIMKLSMDYNMMIQNNKEEEEVDTIDWDAISLGKGYEVPNELLEKIEQYVLPSIFKEESSTRNTSSWTTIDATIVKYNEGDLQVPHIDPCDATLLICLQPSIEGGSTCFPLLNPPLRLENRRGGDGYLFFSSKVLGGGGHGQDDDDDNNGDCNRGRERNALSLHHGGRVTKGNKIVIQLMLKYSGADDLQTWLEVLV
jgi:hypothetical protein